MRYFSMFSGIGGFELGIHRAFNVQEKRGRQKAAQDTPTKDGSRLHPLSEQSSSVIADTNNEHSHRGIDQRQPHCIGYSEIDKYAIKVYERHFNHDNKGDATNINPKDLPDFELLVGGFPCQAFSVAGKRGGFDDTRGTLFFDIARIAAEKRPKHLLLENVKGLLSHDKGKTLQTILGVLTDLGYRVEWQVLNSKHHGVPQNRERIFIIGHLRGECGRQVFPIFGENTAAIKQIGNIDQHKRKRKNPQTGRVYSDEGVSPALSTMQGGGLEPKTLQDTRIRKLTPKECERLQGFPDGWTALGIGDEEISDTQRYKMCGNAVTVNVIERVVNEMKDCLTSNNHKSTM